MDISSRPSFDVMAYSSLPVRLAAWVLKVSGWIGMVDSKIHVVEARDRAVLSRGMQGLKVRLAKRLNQLFGGRRGTVFSERYHAKPLRSPRQVRSALVYVLNNRRRHLAQGGKGLQRDYVDPYSSAPHFEGWEGRIWSSKQLVGERVTVKPTTGFCASAGGATVPSIRTQCRARSLARTGEPCGRLAGGASSKGRRSWPDSC
jgi:hypothetical protein